MPLASNSSSVIFLSDSEIRYKYWDLKEAYISFVNGTSGLSNTSPAGIFWIMLFRFSKYFFLSLSNIRTRPGICRFLSEKIISIHGAARSIVFSMSDLKIARINPNGRRG